MRSNSRLGHAADKCFPLTLPSTDVYKPVYFNGNPHSASSQILRIQLNCLNCQPSQQCTCVPLLSSPSLRSPRLKVWEFPFNVKYMFEYESTIPVKGRNCKPDEITIRCLAGNREAQWRNTVACMTELIIEDDCYRPDSGQYYAVVDDQEEHDLFAECCLQQPWYREV